MDFSQSLANTPAIRANEKQNEQTSRSLELLVITCYSVRHTKTSVCFANNSVIIASATMKLGQNLERVPP